MNMWKFRFSLKYKWKETAQNRHILFIHTWWYQVRWLPEEDDLRLIFRTHTYAHSGVQRLIVTA